MISKDFALAPFQEIGKESLLKSRRLVLADDVGLGKTVQALAAWEEAPAGRTLILVPNHLKYRWVEGIEEQLGLTAGITIVDGNTKQRLEQINSDANILIVSFNTMISDVDLIIKSGKFQIIIIDEAHKLRNRKARWTKAVNKLMLSHKDCYLWQLTATPNVNRGTDLWQLFHNIDPKKFRGYWPWVKKYFKTDIIKYGKSSFPITKVGDCIDPKQFIEDHKQYMLARTNAEVQLFPDQPVRLLIHSLDLTAAQRIAYRRMKKDWIYEHADGEKATIASNGMILQKRLQQICLSPGIIQNNNLDEHDTCKFQFIDDLLESTNDNYFIVTQSRGMVEMITRRYDKEYGVFQIHGDVALKDRAHIAANWSGSRNRILVGIISCVAEGMDGLQYACSDIIFPDIDWSPAINDQIVGRLNRYGQTRQVKAHILLGANTLEHKIYNYVEAKRKSDEIIPTDINLRAILADLDNEKF